MTDQLKTLKDLETWDENSCDIAYSDDLRAEAIKHHKSYQQLHNKKADIYHDNEVERGFPTYWINLGKMEFIEAFFNLTEDDLK